MDFKSMLQEKLGPHNPYEIEDLNLSDDFFGKELSTISPELKICLDEYKNLVRLSLNNIGLEKMEGLPDIKALQILELSGNKLDGSDLDIICKKYPDMYKLKLSDNRISNIENIYKLSSAKLVNFRKLHVQGNPFTKSDADYKEKIFDALNSVQVIDGFDKEGEQIPTSNYDEEEEEEDDEELPEEDDDDFEDVENDVEDEEDFEEEDFEDDEEDEADEDDEDEPPKKKKKN